MRLGLRKRSKSRSYRIGSRSVIAQAVGHRAARRRAPPRPDPDACSTGVADQVPDDQEVRAEAHVADDLELVREALDDRVGQPVAPAGPGALEGEVVQVVAVVLEALGQREVRQERLAELDLDVAALGDPERVVARLGHLGEQVAHLRRGLQVVLVAVELEAVRVAHERTGLHAQQRVVGGGVRAGACSGCRWSRAAAAQIRRAISHQLRVGALLLGHAVVLELDEEVVAAEDVLEPRRLRERRRRSRRGAAPAAPGRRGSRWWRSGPRCASRAGPSRPGLVVVALEEGAARELDQVLVAGVVLGQERQVVVGLAPALGVAAGVVDAARGAAVAPSRES